MKKEAIIKELENKKAKTDNQAVKDVLDKKIQALKNNKIIEK